ncbi:MAG: putative Holliday junction resolvase [Candidatus Omnitrophota bacterium]|jgi:putative Holliday junction resolvase
MRVLSIDYGDKRIGLAMSDPMRITAQGLPTLLNKGEEPSLKAISELCSQNQVGVIVIGLPLHMNGDAGERAKIVLNWKQKLEELVDCEITTWDERLSSREVTRLMIQQDISRKKQKEKCDELSAIIILQGYLEFNRNT